MVRYPEVPAQDVVLYYVLMEFGNRTCAYLYQVADVLWVVLVRVVPVQVQNFSTGWFFQKKSVQITHRYAVQGYRGTCVQVPSPDDPEESWYRCCLECIQFYMSRHLRMLVLDRNNVRIQKNPGSVLIEVPNLYWNVVVVAPSEITVFNLLTSRRLHSVVPPSAGSGHWRARAHANGLQW